MSAEWQGTIITKVKVVVVYYYCLSVGPFTILDLRQIYHTFRIDKFYVFVQITSKMDRFFSLDLTLSKM